MNPDRDKEFDQSLNQLLSLLKKILKNIPLHGQGPFPQSNNGKDPGINLNLCFFTFLPLAPDEMDEIEEMYDHFAFQEEKFEDLTTDLSPEDLEFLKVHGIRF